MEQELDKKRIPTHIAIIMDGNGRWAKERGKERSFGHQAGVDTVRRITSECVRLGVKFLTLYTFSTENWSRPETEIAALMGLVLSSLEDEIEEQCAFPSGGRHATTATIGARQTARNNGTHCSKHRNDYGGGLELLVEMGANQGRKEHR